VTRKLFVALAAMLLASGACYTTNSNLSSEGHGIPQLSVDFPASVTAGSTAELTLTVSNPGPGDMDSVFVAFTAVGVPGSGIGTTIVESGRNGRNPAIAGVDPEPDDVSDDAVVYRFPGLKEGEATTIAFRLVIPHVSGPAANSVQVYDGSEPDRAIGMRVGTTVQG
jgi:hypothetical protein